MSDPTQKELDKTWRFLHRVANQSVILDAEHAARCYLAFHDPHTKYVWGVDMAKTGGSGQELIDDHGGGK